MVKLLIGGSPCTHWSIAQSKNRETKTEGIGWELFLNYVIAKGKFKPDFFLYENNWSASKEIKRQIQRELGHELMRINSSLVSAQNRDRFYVFNWSVEQPEDRGIYLNDILKTGEAYNPTVKGKSHTLTATYYKIGQRTDSHFGCEKCKQRVLDGPGQVRKLHPIECERLQTLPDGYTSAVSNTQRYKGLGNGWTAEVIIHILQGALKNVPKDEKIVVLSMYDGIGTGRYCLDKMGFKNVEYHAYEIDKYAIKVAMSNFPDIIQHGDAFRVRADDWKLL